MKKIFSIDKKITYKKVCIYMIICTILMMFLTGCTNQNEDEQNLQSKITSEIQYLDTQLIGMLNKVNGISFENYIVVAEKVDQQNTDGSKVKQSSEEQSGSSQSGSEENQSNGQQGQSGGEQGQSGGSGQSNNQSSSTQTEKNYMNYEMQPNNILLQPKEADWTSLIADVENLYSSWSTIVLDLYKINVNSNDILSFNTDLDTAAVAIKNQDKQSTLNALAKLYSYIPKYVTAYAKDTTQSGIYQTKSDLLNAYAIIDQNNKDEVKKQLANAEQSFMPIINTIENTNNQYNANKAYILIKEIQNSVDNTDSDIFYIKYKNLMQELNILD